MDYDFYKAANEILSWAETPMGALVVYPTLALATAAACCCGNQIKKWYDKNCCEPERKPFEGIPTQTLPKSKFKL